MASDPTDVAREIGVTQERYVHAPRYNVPPGSALPFISETLTDGGEMVRRLEPAGWGLVPGWANETAPGFRAFNARSETVADKPMFRSAFAHRRCLVPVSGYYEWKTVGSGSKATKTPWLMHAANDDWLFMAGLYEFARIDKLADTFTDSDPRVIDGWYVSTTIITMPASGHLADIHDRMPLMLTREDALRWIQPNGGKAESQELLGALLKAANPEMVARYRVSPDVGNVRNEGAYLQEPL